MIERQNQAMMVKRWYSTSMRVPLYEVDLGQGVYHGNYFHLYEIAREDFLRNIGYPYRRFMENELHLAVVHIECEYRRPLHYDDVIDIKTGVAYWRRRSIEFVQQIYRCESEDSTILCNEAVLTMVCVKWSGRSIPLPADFRQLVQRWVGECKE